MTAWHEDARFDVFTKCDVFIEDDGYLYVENQAHDYDGNYSACHCKIVYEYYDSHYYIWEPWCGASNEYIISLEKAPWNIAREIIERSLKRWQDIEQTLDEEREEDEKVADLIEDARRCIMEYATEDEVFTYC